jgi:HD-like signal output (HDOD) protein
MNDCMFSMKNDSEMERQHAHLGRTLLTKWNIPSKIIDSISPLKMHLKEKDELSLSNIVKVSCIISSMLGIPATKEKINLEYTLYALEQLESALVDDLLFAEIIMKLRSKELLS